MLRPIHRVSGTIFGLVALVPLLLAQQPANQDAGAILRIQTDTTVARVSPTLYGLMTEEINHSYDGGIYAELIRNRAFQDNPNHPDHWRILRDGNARAAMKIDTSTGPSTALNIASLTELALDFNPGSLQRQPVPVSGSVYFSVEKIYSVTL